MSAAEALARFDAAGSRAHAVGRIETLARRFSGTFPSPCTRGGRYEEAANTEWTPGFWTGLLWLAHVATGEPRYRAWAEGLLPSFRARLERGGRDVETHDLGFLYTLSCVLAHRLSGNREARGLALRAAQLLRGRYLEGARVIQAWGRLDDPGERGRILVDTTMNLPLLFWAAEETAEPVYGDVARAHLGQAARYLVRADGSTFHTYRVDAATGEGLGGATHQGYSDDSCWARGQAWALCGFSVAARHTADPSLREVARRVADHFLGRLPRDRVCHWDLVFDEGAEEQKDTSAAAVAASGLLELAAVLPREDPDRGRYARAAREILAALAADHLAVAAGEDGILRHAVYDRPHGHGIDESCLWGDYFFTEALVRLGAPGIRFW